MGVFVTVATRRLKRRARVGEDSEGIGDVHAQVKEDHNGGAYRAYVYTRTND